MQNSSMEPKCVSGFKTEDEASGCGRAQDRAKDVTLLEPKEGREVSRSRDRKRPSKALLDLLAVLLKKSFTVAWRPPTYIEELAKYFPLRETNL